MADELERRVRTLEEELNGERHVSRYAADQARRGTEAFLALRSEVAALRADIAGTTARTDAISENMAIVNSTLVRHGRALDVLMQDVREIRGTQMEMNARLDRMQEETNARFDRLETSVAAILAAVAPRAPA